MNSNDVDATATGDLVAVARVVKPHGIRGEMLVRLLSDIPDRITPGMAVQLDGTDTEVTSVRWHQDRMLLGLASVPDRTAAETMRGLEVFAEPVDVEDLDHWLVSEIVGADLIDVDGSVIGTISGLTEVPAAAGYDLWDVTASDGRVWQLPGHDDLIDIVETDDGPAVQLRVESRSMQLDDAIEIRSTAQPAEDHG